MPEIKCKTWGGNMNTEGQDAIVAAEMEIKAHRLDEFLRNPNNRKDLENLRGELLDKASLVTWNEFDVLTQGALAQILWTLVKDPSSNVIDDFRLAFAVGYILGGGDELGNHKNIQG